MMSRLRRRPLQIPVYNLTVDDAKKRTWKWIMDVGRDLGLKYPFEVGLWYPDGNMTSSKFYHTFCSIMFMWLPAYLIDFLLLIFGQRRLYDSRELRPGAGTLMPYPSSLLSFQHDPGADQDRGGSGSAAVLHNSQLGLQVHAL